MSDYWKARALRAENAFRHVMWISPERTEGTAQEFADRIHADVEKRYPDQVTRITHTYTEVFQMADSCDCDGSDPEYAEWHCETDEDGDYLCGKGFLGYVCEFCEDDDGDGPSWKPNAVEWPCRVIRDLDKSMGRENGD